jgi:hypothetical protein
MNEAGKVQLSRTGVGVEKVGVAFGHCVLEPGILT